MLKYLLFSFLASLALISYSGARQQQELARATEAGIDADGNIYVASDEGKPIKMATAAHCLEAKFAEDRQTVGCSLSRSSKPEEIMQSLRLEIYLKNGKKRIIETETPMDWHFWNGGQQVSVFSRSPDGKGHHALYDSASAHVIEEFAEQSDESLLPQWAKGPAQIQDEAVRTGEQYAQERTAWIAKVMRQITKIKPGMTRKDLLGIFTTEGGLSNRFQRAYVYFECPYIKVDVRFKAANNEEDGLKEDPDDVIESISRPYLGYMVMD
jgi:hypothetical protein